MPRRRLPLLLGLALCGIANASAPPQVELTATAAWKGWTRPGRSTEVDIRLGADAAMTATLEVGAGQRSAHAALELQPARPLRLQIPMEAADQVVVSIAPTAGTAQRREVTLSRSESPLLGVALTSGGTAGLEGFHTVALGADDLPRNPTAYSSLDALIVDATTLGALDQRQLGALLARAAACDRIVVLNLDRVAHRLPDGAVGCGGSALMSAASLPEAVDLLESSLATSRPRPIAFAGIGELAQPDHALWRGVAVALGVYFAVASSMLIFSARLPLLLAAPALCAMAALALLQATKPSSQLVVWSEGASGAGLARYQAWQRFAGTHRGRMHWQLPPQLAAGAQPCDPTSAMRFDVDMRSGQATAVEFETRLFHQVGLCYSGTFPMARALEIGERGDGVRDVRNAGASGWPRGLLLVGGLAHDLPALGAGAGIAVPADNGRPRAGAALRTAQMRTPPGGAAALWELDLGGVTGIPGDAKGWLLVTVSTP